MGTFWDDDAVPILNALAVAESNELSVADLLSSRELATQLEMSERKVTRQLALLAQDGLLEYGDGSSFAGDYYHSVELTPSGMRTVGEWPATSVDQLTKRIDRLILKTDDEETKNVLDRLKSAAAAAGPALVASVINAQL